MPTSKLKGGESMKLLYSAVFSAAVLVSNGLTITDASAIPGNTDNNGNHYGWTNGNGNPHAVPIPGSLLLFGGGFAGLIGWQWMRDRHRSQDTS